MLRRNAKNDWPKIKTDFLKANNYPNLKPFLLEKCGFTEASFDSGQTARKIKEMGGIKELEKEKALRMAKVATTSLLKEPLKYAPKEIVLGTPGQLKASANLAKNSLYKTLMLAVMNIEGKLEAGEMDDMDIVKNAKGFETLVNMFEAIEAGAESLQAYNAGGPGSGSGGGNGLNNQPQLILQVIDNSRKHGKVAKVVDVNVK